MLELFVLAYAFLYWLCLMFLLPVRSKTVNIKRAIKIRETVRKLLQTVVVSNIIVGIFYVDIVSGGKVFGSGMIRFFDLLLAFFLIFTIAHYAIRFVKRLFQPIYTSETVDDLDNIILYLRSFRSETQRRKTIREKGLIEVLTAISPVYAVGNPSEILPPMGARRIYAGDDWKEVVAEMMYKSKIIVLNIDVTENFIWEASHCTERNFLNKSLFIASKAENYQLFRDEMSTGKSLAFPEIAFKKGHVYFIYKNAEEDEWQFIAVADNKRSIENALLHYLDVHPELNEYNEQRIKYRKKILRYIFKNEIFPKEVGYFNFGMTYQIIYMIDNCWKFEFYVILVAGVIVSAIVGSPWPLYALILFLIIYANRISWLSKRWEGVKSFKKKQMKWNIYAILSILFLLLFGGKMLVYIESLRKLNL